MSRALCATLSVLNRGLGKQGAASSQRACRDWRRPPIQYAVICQCCLVSEKWRRSGFLAREGRSSAAPLGCPAARYLGTLQPGVSTAHRDYGRPELSDREAGWRAYFGPRVDLIQPSLTFGCLVGKGACASDWHGSGRLVDHRRVPPGVRERDLRPRNGVSTLL